MSHCVIDSPVGYLRIEERGGAICRLDRALNEPLLAPDAPVLQEAQRQLAEYFAGTRREFDLPLHTSGTEFQELCWAALRRIPYGQTISYGQQAKNIGRPKAVRAVGGANHRNPISILIPCHRVIGASGALTGYGGGIDMKEWLLRHEQSHSEGK